MGWRGWESWAPTEAELKRSRLRLEPERQKFGNVPTRGFASKKEARRYDELKARLLAGDITDLECQPEWVMHTRTPEGELIKVGRFKADFRYRELIMRMSSGEPMYVVRVEEVKGGKATKTTAYQLRKKHVEAEYGITIREI